MPPVSHLFLPPMSLGGCVVAGIFRDTRGTDLSDADRVNHFPATPLISVTLVLHGSLYLIPPMGDWRDARNRAPLPRVFVTGPQSAPTSSWADGGVTALTVGIFPDAWQVLCGDPGSSELPALFAVALDKFANGHDPAEGWTRFCDELSPSWRQVRRQGWHNASGTADWVKALATRAALSGTGRSVRSIERRIKRYSGQTRRTLDFFASIEALHRKTVSRGDINLADLAVEAGYADQSHMGRAVRRATGLSPARLNRAIATQEPFWCYRLLGERY